jgi:CheY-like chemotaxis protein
MSEQPTAAERALRVLAVDDHPTNLMVMEAILGLVAAEVVCAVNGAEAVAAAQRARFDIILMDLQMPVMDGLHATREIRRLEAAEGWARTPLLVVTANTLSDHIRDALAAGADDHLAKPVTPDGLLGRIQALLQAAASWRAGPHGVPQGAAA